MGNNIFKRVEQKYILSFKEYKLLQKMIRERFNKDKYYKSKIYNIYFDNDNNDMIINSIEKPIFKDKIRVRSYSEVKDDDDIVYLEMKQKYKHVVYKRRVMMTFKEYNDYINNHVISDNAGQIMKEIDYYINYYKVFPYMSVMYDRVSYYSKEDENLRVTFDSNLRSRRCNLGLCDDKIDEKYFDDDMYIMEVKGINNLPKWFVDVLSTNKIYPRSFSKVGSIYIKNMIDWRGSKC